MDTSASNNPPLDGNERLRLRLRAAELITSAMEAADPAERERLFAKARALIARADRSVTSNGHF